MPGAGSIRAANHIYNAAPQDGTAIGAMSSNVPMQPLINPEGIQYDLRKVRWLPTPSRSVNTLVVWHTSPIKRFEDLRGQEAAVGTLAPGSSPTTAIGIYKHVLGAKIKAVLGYAGLPEAMLAMQRGEIEGYPTIPVDTLKRTYGALLKEGKLRVLTQNGDVRHPDLADVPTSKELAGSEEDRKLVGLATFTTQITLPYIMGPGVSDQRLQTMRAAMNAMFADPAFLKDAESRQLWIDPVGSDEVARIVGEAYDTSPAIVKRLQDIVALQGK
jgi:tripartite-type tricarboxylate transporter receptor subunit TctC